MSNRRRSDRPALHFAPTNGWRVAPHVVERFVRRVASEDYENVASWLRDNVFRASYAGMNTSQGDRVYILEHPFHGPPAALVVKEDPDGCKAAVTCGWWEKDPDPWRQRKPPRSRMATRPGVKFGKPKMMAEPNKPLTEQEILIGNSRRRRP